MAGRSLWDECLVSSVRDLGLFLNTGCSATPATEKRDPSRLPYTKRLFSRSLNMLYRHLPLSLPVFPGAWSKDHERASPRHASSPPAAHGRISCALTWKCKIAHGALELPWGTTLAAPTRSGLHGQAFKIHVQLCNIRFQQHVFSVRVVPS